MEHRSIEGTVVAVTGATSGIGQAIARQLAAAGVRVVVNGRRGRRLEELAAECGPEQIAVVEGDISDPAVAERVLAEAVRRWGRLDSLVASAGIGMYGGILDHDDAALDTMLRVNIQGTLWPVRAATRRFREQGDGGDIVVVASVAGFRGGPNEAVYAASKFAQIGLTSAMERELAPDGIRVTSVCPAATDSEFAIGAGRVAGDPALAGYLRPDDVADAILTVLRQPRRVRTSVWSLWSMAQG